MKTRLQRQLHTFVEASGALRAADAGEMIAALIGLSEPISEVAMWRLARLGHIPCTRLGARVFFRAEDLRAFVAGGGSVRP